MKIKGTIKIKHNQIKSGRKVHVSEPYLLTEYLRPATVQGTQTSEPLSIKNVTKMSSKQFTKDYLSL